MKCEWNVIRGVVIDCQFAIKKLDQRWRLPAIQGASEMPQTTFN